MENFGATAARKCKLKLVAKYISQFFKIYILSN